MANLNFITGQLAAGGDLPYDESEAIVALEELVEMGITHIIDNRIEWSDAPLVAMQAPTIGYLHNPADDAGQRMPDQWFDDGVAFALAALADPAAKVLAHCHMGINRGPSMAYAVLLAQGWDPVGAIDRIRERRAIAATSYAEDALDWHHRRTDATATRRAADRAALAEWRRTHWIDVVRIIGRIRADEGQTA